MFKIRVYIRRSCIISIATRAHTPSGNVSYRTLTLFLAYFGSCWSVSAEWQTTLLGTVL